MPIRTGTDPCSRGCLSCGPGMSARRDRRSPVPAGSDGRESFAPRLCQLGCGTPRRSVERFVDSPNGDYVASFRRPHERVLRSALSGPASGGASMRTACGIFACSWLCEWLSPLNCLKARKPNERDESVRSVYARFGGLFVDQLVDQLRQDFEAAAACKCDTC